MALVADIKKTVTDTTPVYAAVGATDLAVEKVRDARVRATAARAELSAEKLQARVAKRATEVTEQAQHAPVVALNRSLEIASKAYDSYESLAARGESLVKRCAPRRPPRTSSRRPRPPSRSARVPSPPSARPPSTSSAPPRPR